jgi:hypothetical protein
LGYAVTDVIEFPSMRAEVIEALRALSDPVHQRTRWGRFEPGVDYYDDLDMNIHILYDDCAVLPDPASSVRSLLRPTEVATLSAVDSVLGPLIRELGDRPDEDYMAHPGWADVVEASAAALAAMQLPGGDDLN